MAQGRNLPGPPMTLGNMRQLGMRRPLAYCLNNAERARKCGPNLGKFSCDFFPTNFLGAMRDSF
jgi:hypothetical protein